MDVVLLSRLQFALTIGFHYIFPPLTIGMGVVMVYLEAQHLRTGEQLFEKAAKFWTRIFALNFAGGVASGIVMEFQFGTNWAAYSRFVGDVFAVFIAKGFIGHVPKGHFRRPPERRKTLGFEPFIDINSDGVAGVHFVGSFPCHDIGKPRSGSSAEKRKQTLFLEFVMPF